MEGVPFVPLAAKRVVLAAFIRATLGAHDPAYAEPGRVAVHPDDRADEGRNAGDRALLMGRPARYAEALWAGSDPSAERAASGAELVVPHRFHVLVVRGVAPTEGRLAAEDAFVEWMEGAAEATPGLLVALRRTPALLLADYAAELVAAGVAVPAGAPRAVEISPPTDVAARFQDVAVKGAEEWHALDFDLTLT